MFFFEHGDDPRIIKYVKDLAIPIATEVNILDPDYIIIAGGVVYMKNFPKDILIDSVHFHTRKPYPEKNLRILFRSIHNRAEFTGVETLHGISLNSSFDC